MIDLINEFSNKLKIKKHLFLVNQYFNLYKNIYKEESSISKDILKNRLVEVIDDNKVNDEHFYLVAADGNKLGWVTLETPLFIYQTFPEKIVVKNKNTNNIVNEILNLYNSVEEDKIYTKKYFIEYAGNLYFGIVKDDKIIAFLQKDQISNGEISLRSFKFIRNEVSIYQDINLLSEYRFLNNGEKYYCDKLLQLQNEEIGSFKLGQTRYWFEISDSDIDLGDVDDFIERDMDYYLIEHLFYSQKTFDINQYQNESVMKIEEDIIKKRFADYRERINELLTENEKLKSELLEKN